MSLPTDKKARKETPMYSGLLKYFPKALAAVARVSYIGNEQHNPGQPLHWSREKSNDHHDCATRHLTESGSFDDDGQRHTAKSAWRVLAALELEIEAAEERQRGDVTAFKQSDRMDDPEQGIVNHFQEMAAAKKRIDRGKFDTDASTWTHPPIDLNEHEHKPTKEARKPICYIAGPMTGYTDYNFPAFYAAEKKLIDAGFEVINPARMDDELDGGKKCLATVYAERDTRAIIEIAEKNIPGSCLVLLPGWERSKGATAEYRLAKWIGLSVRTIGEF